MLDPLASATRNERRVILRQEREARVSGNWGPWERADLAPGTIPGAAGWLRDVSRAYRNKVFAVLVRDAGLGVVHLAVSSLSGVRPTWPEMQRIKDEIAGKHATGIEVYPPHDKITDGADMFHLWVLPTSLPFGLHVHERVVSTEESQQP